jgi:F-type H+-transporting ATPase subunit delta
LIGDTVSRRYAKALIDLVKKSGNYEEVTKELKDFASLIEGDSNLKDMLYNPSINLNMKKDLLAILLQEANPSPLTANFLRLLLDKGRLKNLAVIGDIFEGLALEALNKVKVLVKTPLPLKVHEAEFLRLKLEVITNKQIVLEPSIDASLIGGIFLQIGSTIYDGTIKGQLEVLKEKLIGRGGA